MPAVKSRRNKAPRIESFDLHPGRVIAGKYMVEKRLGGGWEGEVYKVVETRTGVHRAAKLFYPERNRKDRAVKHYAQKLERLRSCSMVVAPMIVLVRNGRLFTKASAICDNSRPCRCARVAYSPVACAAAGLLYRV